MKNKNVITIILIILIVLGLLGLTFIVGGKGSDVSATLSNEPSVILANAQSESAAVKDSEKREFIQINMNEYLQYYTGSTPTCGYCQIAEPIIQNIAYQYNIDVHYLNTDNFSEEDQTTFVTSNEFFNTGYGTPILFIVQNSTIIDKVDGLTDYAHYIDFLTRNGYIQ